MKLMSQQGISDDSAWERFEAKMKEWLYTLMHELLQTQMASPFLYKLLIFIQTIQMLYYSIAKNITFIWNTSFLDYIRQVIQYFQVSSILSEGDESVFLTILYIVFSIVFLMFLFFCISSCLVLDTHQQTSTMLTYIIQLLSTFALLLNTILVIPFFNVFFAALFCNADAAIHPRNTCYSGVYFVHLSLSILGTLILIFFSVLFGILYVDLNPNSTIPFASPKNSINMFVLLLKYLLPLYAVIDLKGSFSKEFIAILQVFYFLVLVMRYRATPMYHKSVYEWTMKSEALLFWVNLCLVITAFLDFDAVDNIGLLYCVLGSPFLLVTYARIIENKNRSYLRMNIRELKKEEDVEVYVNQLIDLIENSEKDQYRIMLEGVLRYHMKGCRNQLCACVALENQNRNSDNDDNQGGTQKWYQYVRSVLVESLTRFGKSPQLHLLQSHIQHEKLQNQFKALSELTATWENQPNIQEEFAVFRYTNQIEEEMIEQDGRSDNKTVNVNTIVHFQNNFVIFLSAIDRSVTLHLEFWRELLEDNPDIQKLQNLGSKITNTVEEATELYNRLNSNAQTPHIQCLEIYGNFLKDIVNDSDESIKILEKAEYFNKTTVNNKQIIQNDKMKYGENSNTCVIIISGNVNNRGVVTSCNNEINRILGFSQNDIMDQNIQRIMPQIYADLHDDFLKNYLESSQPKVIGVQRFLLAINKQGYLVPITLMIKVLPSLEDGIQIVGFIKQAEALRSEFEFEERNHYIMYGTESQLVYGVSQSCYNFLGIPAHLCNSTNPDKFTIDSICPQVIDPNNEEELKNGNGKECILDTTVIQKNFLIENEDDIDMDDFEQVEDEDMHQPNANIISAQKDNEHSRLMGGSAIGGVQMSGVNPTPAGAVTAGGVGGSFLEAQNPNVTGQKKSKYKRIKIKAFIVSSEEYSDTKITILKFNEIDEEYLLSKEMSGENMRSANISKEPGDEQVELKDNEQKIGETQGPAAAVANAGFNDEGQESMRESNIEGSEIQDGIRQIQDLRAGLSEKTEPASIQKLQRTVFLLLIILCVLSGVGLAFKFEQTSDVDEGVQAIKVAYERSNVMVDVNYLARKLYLVSNQILLPKIKTTALRNLLTILYSDQMKSLGGVVQKDLTGVVDLLQSTHFEVIKSDIKKNTRSGTTDNTKYDIKFQIQNGEIKTYPNIYTDAVFQYITAASSLTNSTLYSFYNTKDGETTDSFIESTKKNFFFVRENGLFVLRSGGEVISESYYKYYQNLTNDSETKFLIIMILGISFLFLSQLILIPIVFDVHQTNSMVLSYFAMIPSDEIRILTIKCERFQIEFLNEKNQKLQQEKGHQDLEGMKSGGADNGKSQQNQGGEVPGNGEPLDPHKNPNYYEVNNEDPSDVREENVKNALVGNDPSQTTQNTLVPGGKPGVASAATPGAPIVVVNNPEAERQKKENDEHFQKILDLTIQILKSADQFEKIQDPQKYIDEVCSQDLVNRMTIAQVNHMIKQIDASLSVYVWAQMDQKHQDMINSDMNRQVEQGQNELRRQGQYGEKDFERKQGDDDGETGRASKLQNSKDGNRKVIIFQFFTIAAVFIAYFVADYLLEIQFLSDVRQTYKHLMLVSKRASLVKYNIMFTLEEIVNATPQLTGSRDLRELYSDYIYENEREIFESYQSSYPSQFDNYKTQFTNVNYGGICSNSFPQNSPSIKADCLEVYQGILEKGLRTSIVSLVENTRAIISNFKFTKMDGESIKEYVNSQNYLTIEQIQEYIIPAISDLNQILASAITTYQADMRQVEEIKFSVFIVVLFIVFVIIWTYYLDALNTQIWRTKGMLKMIPNDIIKQNPQLQEEIQKSDIMHSVK